MNFFLQNLAYYMGVFETGCMGPNEVVLFFEALGDAGLWPVLPNTYKRAAKELGLPPVRLKRRVYDVALAHFNNGRIHNG